MKYIYFIILVFLANLLFSYEYLSEDSDFIDVYFEKMESGGYSFYADNRHFIPQFISLGFTTLNNMVMDRENPSRITLQPGDEKVLIAVLKPNIENRSYSFRSRLSFTNGDPLTVVPDDYLYILPFENGKKYKLDQGFGGKFSHQKENFYALDFSMDIGTAVCAAREGIVVEVKEDSNRGGASASYANYGNYIVVYHSDGTFASYVHLKLNGSLVNVGDKVTPGEVIGYSGNTGLSTGPHLHFSVNIPTIEGSRQSIPIKLKGVNGESVDPEVGEYYYSKHPDGENFEVYYGKDITDGDYEGYLEPVDETNTLKFRDESVDSTTVIYCRNGFDKTVNGKVSFSLSNSRTGKKSPIEIELPPLSEVFITTVKPINPGKPFQFSYTISYSIQE